LAWHDDFWGNTYQTSTGNVNFGLQIYYDRKFLKRAIQELRLVPLGQKRPLPMGSGKQIRFFRYDTIDPSTSALTEGINPNATVVTGQEVNATLEEWGAFSQHSSLVSNIHIDRKLNGVVDLWGEQAAESVDLRTWKEVAQNGIWPIRVDSLTENDPTSYSVNGTVVTETTLNSTTVVCVGTSASVGSSNDWWNGGILEVYEGTNMGQSRVVSDYSAGTTVATITVASAFEASCDGTSKFRLVTTAGLTAGDIPTYDSFREVVANLKANRAMPMDNGYYVALMHPFVTADLMSDSTWTGVEQYRGSASKIYQGEVGKFMGVRVIETTRPFRCAANTHGTYSATGNVYTNLFLGREAFGITTFPGKTKPKIIIKNPGPQDTSNPLNRFSTVGWRLDFVPKALNANWAIGLFTYH